MSTVIPKQHYVTIQYRKDSSTESGLLGFASPYTKDAAFQKRKNTQDNWAYHGCAKVNINPDDDSISLEQTETDTTRWNYFDVGALFITKCYPMIMDNVPTPGFEVAKSVKRCGWNGGNVVWRIADPRGFELEISSANFARVLDCTTIINGVIQGECVWGRDGANNILLPVASDVYQEAVRQTVKTNIKISLKDVQIGDTVELLTKDNTDDDKFVYFGKNYVLCRDTDYNRGGYNSRRYKFTAQVERYILKSVKTGEYLAMTTPKLTAIVNKVATPMDRLDAAKQITADLIAGTKIDTIYHPILVTPTKTAKIDVKLIPFTDPIGSEWPTRDKYYSQAIVCKIGDEYWVAQNSDNRHHLTPPPFLFLQSSSTTVLPWTSASASAPASAFIGTGLHPTTLQYNSVTQGS